MEEQRLSKGWIVSSIGDVCSKVTDGSHNPPKASELGLPMLSAKNIHDGIVDFHASFRLIPAESFEIEDRRTDVQENDVLLTSACPETVDLSVTARIAFLHIQEETPHVNKSGKSAGLQQITTFMPDSQPRLDTDLSAASRFRH